MKKRKSKILEAKYDEEKDVVIWLVEYLDTNETQYLLWPSGDLSEALGITMKIPKELLNKFCKDMTGKELNLVIEGTMNIPVHDYDKNDTNREKQIGEEISNMMTDAANKFMNS